MGLGGITRDSIVGLNRLVHDDDEDDLPPRHNRTGSWNSGSKKGTNDFAFLEGDDPIVTSESSTFETSLNDGSTTTMGTPLTTPAPPSPSRSSSAVAAATSYNKVSATNSRSLDSYKSKDSAQSVHYQGFQYEGYTDYYSEDYNYEDYGGYSNGVQSKGEKKNIFCCLFAPWMQPTTIEPDNNKAEDTEVDPKTSKQEEVAAPALDEGKAAVDSSSVSVLEKASASARPSLSPTPSLKEKIPVATSLGVGTMPDTPPKPETPDLPNLLPSAKTPSVARAKTPSIEFAAPQEPKPATAHMLSDGLESVSSVQESVDEKKQDEGDLTRPDKGNESDDKPEEAEGPPPVKSILKVRRCSNSNLTNLNTNKKGSKEAAPSPDGMRHLFPTYEAKSSHSSAGGEESEVREIKFNPMARVLTIPSRKDIPLHQKARVWWQRCDYDEFKKTGRIISKAMECGGSEIWLASSNAWGNRAAKDQNSPKDSDIDEEYNKALSKYVSSEEKKDDEITGTPAGNKWWCKFGHSRRGLEHVASSSEGKARQQSVLLARRMVMEEQKRQRASRTKDPNKLRNIAMQYTSWARDLALAGGAADAEAVVSGFNPAAKSRARHFAIRLGDQTDALGCPVGGGVAMAVTSQLLDANTHGSPMMKKLNAKKTVTAVDHSGDSLSKRAKGYMPGGAEDVSAAALLSGMGYQSTVKV
ncbi:hypothetical protein ACHAXR_012708 [Thalassiosira sp. AJA248-18]